MKEFKIRCSAIGKIMAGTIGLTEKQTELYNELSAKPTLTIKQAETKADLYAKSLNKELPQTAKSYCEEWLKEQLYQRRKEFSNKYTQKGLIVEDNSIDFIAERLGYGMLFKNEKHYSNEFIEGTPDIVVNKAIDAKNSWDVFTFPLFDTEIPNMDYWWQGQGYMELTGLKQYVLAYVLSDTPDNLIEREIRSYCYQNGIEDIDSDLYEMFHAKMTYQDVKPELKFKKFEFAYDTEAIKRIEERVKLCRKYIETLLLSVK